MDDASITGALNNQMLRLAVVFPPYQNSWLRACVWVAAYELLTALLALELALPE